MEIKDSRAAESDEGDGKQNPGKREECIHHDDVDEAVDASAVVAGNGADYEAERERREHDATSHEHRDTSAVDDARENVASEFVGAEPVRVRRQSETGRQIDRSRLL